MKKVPPLDTRKLLEQYMIKFHRELEGSMAQTYLRNRGISNAAVNYFQLGFVSDPPKGYEDFNHRLAIPYIIGGHVLGFKFRSLQDKGTRYLSSPGFYGKRFFYTDWLQTTAPRIYVTEGELDLITLWQLGVPAVGIPGANSYDPIMARALRNREVVVLVDGKGKSEEGVKAGQNFAKQILSTVDEGYKIVMEDTDVNQFFLDHGAEKLLQHIGWE